MKLRWTAGHVVLDDPHDFKNFKLVVEASDWRLDELAAAFNGVARFDDRFTGWVSEAALRHWPGQEDIEGWQQGLDKMIAKARPHGWIDETSGAIKAHVEWIEGATG